MCKRYLHSAGLIPNVLGKRPDTTVLIPLSDLPTSSLHLCIKQLDNAARMLI